MPNGTTIVINDGTLGIADGAFNNCNGLIAVSIPEGVMNIGNTAFGRCNLTSVTIPSSVTNIDNGAFIQCSSLSSITIPSSVKSIGLNAFYETAWYNAQPVGLVYAGEVAYKYKGAMPDNTTIDIKDGTVGIAADAFCDCSGLVSVNIPSSVKNIGSWAFQRCNGLTSVAIPEGVTSIGFYAFEECKKLSSVIIPEGLKNIEGSVFSGCYSLTNVTIPNSVEGIGDNAFYQCGSLTSVTMGNSVKTIGEMAFYFDDLTELEIMTENPPIAVFKTFYSYSTTLYVPHGCKAVYEDADYWKEFKEIVEIKPKCATPTITFANGKLTFDCETKDVEFVYNISMSGEQSSTGSEVFLANTTTTYTVSVYSTKEGYENSDVVMMDIDFKALPGDVNNDGDITIADAVAVVDLILNAVPEPKFYYSVGTEEVTADNYTTANGAQYKSSLAEIPETLDLSAISQQQAVILLPEGCIPMIRSASGLVGTTSVSLGNGYMVYTTTSAINGSECTCAVYK